ncbi:ADP-ribosylation factor-like protein 6-interacting protein 1 isoform X3 [Strongylocentrotus purpuratus]|uniref:RETREG1-3/ARL6IP-like N-terminal reticulon-homology domain-containing protein n=1 Tax=Strongylocentrotus purpuratus TaxID=7668 RepID=A0A7M7HI88_STRPU|nr:ADP-ribosylation factor-like protein 6-interacting protein 1 isoform X3 [Strongylocentrotus purpuratus]XP_030840273.1 ADP-ribosylation factor-like protein 6-interacting protein 1 isoform X3 [Strongylocentrotus purpuratus]|eukprot:XP_011678974.1 PREDICTED: ADP-ribosylation factor-like protein 6-interacting protein 1 isoform X3 [Strongylocentrotus purpuratus]
MFISAEIYQEIEAEVNDLNPMLDSLADWKHIIVRADAWLQWDEDSYPYIMCAAITVFYILIWLIQPSILTTVSLIIMTVCLLDFMVPSVFKEYFKKQAWSEFKQRRYEKCCSKLLNTQKMFMSTGRWILNLREKKPKYYFLGASVTLLTIAFVGNSIHGLFLAYLSTIFLALFPGLLYYGILASWYAKVLEVFVNLLKGHKKRD